MVGYLQQYGMIPSPATYFFPYCGSRPAWSQHPSHRLLKLFIFWVGRMVPALDTKRGGKESIPSTDVQDGIDGDHTYEC